MGEKRGLTKWEKIGRCVAIVAAVFGISMLVIFAVPKIAKVVDYFFPEEKISIVSACKRDLSNPNAVVPVDGSCRDVVLVSGLIEDETVRQFKKLAKPVELAARGIDTVCFDSKGGEPISGYELAVEIKARKLNTCIADLYILGTGEDGLKITVPTSIKSEQYVRCASTCPFVFLAGLERILLGDNTLVKVHKFGKVVKILNKIEVERKDVEIPDDNFFRKMSELVSDQHKVGVMKFYKKAMEKKFTDENLLVIPSDELVGMNVVTKWDKTL